MNQSKSACPSILNSACPSILYIYIYIVESRKKMQTKFTLLETFYIVTSGFTLSLDSGLQKYYEKPLRTLILFIENIFHNHSGKNVLNKQL